MMDELILAVAPHARPAGEHAPHAEAAGVRGLTPPRWPSVAPNRIEQFRSLDAAAAPAPALPATPPRAGARGGTAVLDEPLSVKEERILQLIAEDKSNKQIGAAVFLAEGTLKSYVSRVMDKLHARSRTELAVRALHRPGARA